jgi:hypothetical protein
VGDADLRRLSRYTWIRGLDLSRTTIDKDEVAAAAAFPRLVSLKLRDTHVTDESIAPLSAAVQLRELDLSGTQVTYAGLETVDDSLPLVNVCETYALNQGPFPGVFLRPSSTHRAEQFTSRTLRHENSRATKS